MNMKPIRLAALLLALTLLCGCGSGLAPTTTVPPEPTYTYREAVSQSPSCYSPLDYRTDADSAILSYTAMGLYAPALENGSYALVPEMAAADPVDISADFGQPQGRVWQIELNPEACWEDGTPITAADYVFSLRSALEYGSSRATRFFSDNLCIRNAWDFYMGDSHDRTRFISLAQAGYANAAQAINDGHTLYLDMEGFWNLSCGWQSIESTQTFRDEAVEEGQPEDYVSPAYLYETYLADGTPYSVYQNTFLGIVEDRAEPVQWQDVGLRQAGRYRLVLELERSVTPGQLKWELCAPFLVPENGHSQTYGIPGGYYLSCGPYRLVSATDGQVRLTRNETWYGYRDGKHEGQYQATDILCRVLTQEQALAAFEAGELDTVSLTSGTRGKPIPQTYTSKLTFNTSRTALELRQRPGINKTILAYRDFRQAISLALDREAFVDTCVPGSVPTLGLLNEVFLTDLDSGSFYRDSEAGQQVLKNVYGGNSLGYDPEAASALLQSAYDQALADGAIGEEDLVELEFLVYMDDAVYESIVNFLQGTLNQISRGTSLEDRIRVVMTPDANYYDSAREGRFEIILSTWGGSAADPYSILSCYCDREKVYEYGFDPSAQLCTLSPDGTEVTRTYRGWFEQMRAAEDPALRLEILSALEESLLLRFDCVPVYERNLWLLDSERIQRPVEEAVPLLDFGGVRYAVFTQADEV